jgi:hypothetical protein
MAAGLRKLRRASSRTDRPLGHPTQLPRGDLDWLVAYRRTINPNTATPTVKITNSKSAILNSRLVLMSGHTALARANDTCVSKVLERYTPLWEVRHAPTGEPG